MLTFSARAKLCINSTAKKLFELMDYKKTNLAVAADVTTSNKLLELVEAVGPEICVLKTHIDIIEDFTPDLIIKLQNLAEKYAFLIFEDRKFADIGNTVKAQYAGGIYHIANWADIINAHTVPGPGIIEGLKEIGNPLGRGLLLLAEMSSKANLARGEYTEKTLTMAEAYNDFVIGFITTHKLLDDPRFINFTPGVNLEQTGDTLKQQYIAPEEAIAKRHSDIIIVGRGIYGAKTPTLMAEAAKLYRHEGWQHYLALIK